MNNLKKLDYRKGDQSKNKTLTVEASSSESFPSIIFPWRIIKYKQPPIGYHFAQIGREVKPSSFFLCMFSILLFCTAALTTGVSLWAIAQKLPHRISFTQSLFFPLDKFNLCGGLLCVPASWIIWTLHENKKNYHLLPLFLVMIIPACFLMIAGASGGLMLRSKLHFFNSTHLGGYQETIGKAMYESLRNYEKNKYEWDDIHSQYKCCGVKNSSDYVSIGGKVPQSCIYTNGCLSSIIYYITWQACFQTGVAFIVIMVQVVVTFFVTYLYVREQVWKHNCCDNK